MRRHLACALAVILVIAGGLIHARSPEGGWAARESWSDIWQRRGSPAVAPSTVDDLIAIDGFDHAHDFKRVLQDYASLVKVGADDVVCDVGSGSGAFLHVLPRMKLAVCVDLSLNLLHVSHRFMKQHRPGMRALHVQGTMTDLWQVPSSLCDVAVVQSVFQYLPDLKTVKAAVSELERITKPGGSIYLFDLRDGDKEKYTALRSKAGITHSDPHLFVPRSFWGSAWKVHDPLAATKKLYYNAPFAYNVVRKAR